MHNENPTAPTPPQNKKAKEKKKMSIDYLGGEVVPYSIGLS